jgi:SAM-dependent methyltransferase
MTVPIRATGRRLCEGPAFFASSELSVPENVSKLGMKLCYKCGSKIERADWQCPYCRESPKMINGFLSFAPNNAENNVGFRLEYFAELANLEARNFWFRARNQLIMWALRRYLPNAKSFLEIGCGTGFVLSGIADALPNLKLSGSEIYSAGLAFAAGRANTSTFFQMDARHIPFEEEFDVIGAFDVLEHIQEDERVLSRMHRAVCKGGGAILTVPQHPFLWSRQDEYACHVRRYTLAELKTKVERAGFVVEKALSFVSLLLPLLMIARFRKRKPLAEFDPLEELRITGVKNTLLEKALTFERALIKLGVSFPAGGSLLLVVKKPK